MRRIIMRCHADRQLLPRTVNLHRHRNGAVIRANRIHHLLPRFNRLPVNCSNAVIRHQPCIRRRIIRKHRTKDGRRVRCLHSGEEENAEEEHHRQDEVHRRSRQNHNHARKNRFAAVAALACVVVVRRHARNIVETAERHNADRVDRLSIAEADKARSKTDRKFVDAHPRELRRDEMSKFMHKDEKPEDKDRRKYFF